MTKRDLNLIGVTALIMCIPIVIIAHKNQDKYLQSNAYDWNQIKVKSIPQGERREIFDAATETLDRLELHVTTLNPGDSSHAPHKHPEEEMLIIKEGTAKALVDGEWKVIGPGSVVYEAANHLHAIKNAGTTPTTYYALQWRTPKTGKSN